MGQLMIVSVSHSFDFLNQNRVSDSIMALKNDQQMIRDSVVELRGLEFVLNEDNGTLKWALELQPGELKELLIKYEVKYPKKSS